MVGRCTTALLALLAAVVLAGCGSSSSKAGNAYKTPRPVVVTTPRKAALKTTVTMVNGGGTYAYKPKTLKVKAGTLITFKNDSDAPHTVTFVGRNLPNKMVNQGKSTTITITRGGSYSYYCTIHPYMKGALIVSAG